MRMTHNEITSLRIRVIAEALAVHVTSAPDGDVYQDEEAPTPPRVLALRELTGGDPRGVLEFTAKLMSEDVVPMPDSFRRLCLFVALADGCSYSDVNRAFGIAPSHASRLVNKEGEGRDAVAAVYKQRRDEAVALLNVNVAAILDPEQAQQDAMQDIDAAHEDALPVLQTNTANTLSGVEAPLAPPTPEFGDPEPAPGVTPIGPAGAEQA